MDANVIGLRNLLDFYKNKKIKAMLFFLQAKSMATQIKKIFPQRKHIEEMYPVLDREHAMTSLKGLAKHYV